MSIGKSGIIKSECQSVRPNVHTTWEFFYLVLTEISDFCCELFLGSKSKHIHWSIFLPVKSRFVCPPCKLLGNAMRTTTFYDALGIPVAFFT